MVLILDALGTKIDGNNYAIVGAGLYLGSFTATAAYKAMSKGDADQDSISATAQYVFGGQFVVKAGYATTLDSETNAFDDSDTSNHWSSRLHLTKHILIL